MTESRAVLERHAARFLAGLLGCPLEDAWLQSLTLQTFTDKEPKPKPDPLARVLIGSLDERAKELDRLNLEGAGIFVTVNGTDGKGRRKANVTVLRGWHADLDLKDASETLNLARLPLAPTITVRTPGGWHLYWIAPAPMPCDSGARRDEHEAELRGIQKALTTYGADPKVCDVLRVMRLPGFLHKKADPRLVSLVSADGPRWTREEIRASFPPQERQAKNGPEPHKETHKVPRSESHRVLKRAGAYLATLPGAIQGSDGSGTTFQAALKTITRFDLTEDEAFDLMQTVHNPRCEPAWCEDELRHKVADAWNKAQASSELGCALRDEVSPSPGLPQEEDAWPDDDFLEPALDELPWPDDEDAPPALKSIDEPGRPKVRGFAWKKTGLFKSGSPAKTLPSGDEVPPGPPVWIAPAFTLPGLVRNLDSQGWRLLIAWKDLDGVAHEEAVPFELMSGEGAELARTLGQGGMVVSPEPVRRKDLLRYLSGAVPQVKARVRLVDALGWQGGAFVLPGGQTIGQAGEPVRFSGDAPGGRAHATSGTLGDWQGEVARYAVGNPRLAFGLACAFAGPLLSLVRPDGGGGFNLQGFSSKGKSTILEVAASVWGPPDPLPTWRATGNGLEGIASARNDGFLVLDELGQVDPKEAGPVAYMLANGSPKARMTREGGNRPMKPWRLVFLSSGEQGLEDKLSEDGKRPKAGQEVRVPDIPCPSTGMFEEAHGFPGMGQFAEHLKAQARKHYGLAARAFLVNLCDEWSRRDALQVRLKAMEAAWLTSAIPQGADPQVRRVGGRFALVAVAGELARTMGILPWPEGESERAALVCFKAWLDRRGFSGASEVHKGIHAVLAFLERNGQARFDEWGNREAHVINRAGTRKQAEGIDGWDFYITSDGWREACQGFTARDVARACAEAGILEAGKDGKSAQSVAIPGHGKTRCYVIRSRARAHYQEGEAA